MSITHVDKSSINGLGLLAKSSIDPGCVVIQFKGIEARHWSIHLIELEGRYIEVTNAAKYVNHSSDPNTVMIGDTLFAIRLIEEDEEITFDYGCGDECFVDTKSV